jgi:hypothetical protein
MVNSNTDGLITRYALSRCLTTRITAVFVRKTMDKVQHVKAVLFFTGKCIYL